MMADQLEELGTAGCRPLYMSDAWFRQLDQLVGELRGLHGKAAKLEYDESKTLEAVRESLDDNG